MDTAWAMTNFMGPAPTPNRRTKRIVAAIKMIAAGAAVIAAVVELRHASGGFKWNDQRATKLVAGPYGAAIPKGWRDARELSDGKQRAKVLAAFPQMGTTILLPGDMVDWKGSMVFGWIPNDGSTTCDAFATELPSTGVAVSGREAVRHDQVDGCKLTGSKAGDAVELYVLPGRDHTLFQMCLGGRDTIAACDATFTNLVKL